MKFALFHIIKEDEHRLSAANFITLARIIFLPFIVYFLQQDTPSSDYYALLFMFLAGVTDFLDGRVARYYNQKSDLGRILDPVIDKLSVGIVMLVLAANKSLPLWYALIVIGRDVILLVTSLFVISKIRLIAESDTLGKYTATCLALVIISFTIGIPVVKWILLTVSLVLIPATLVSYYRTHQDVVRKLKKGRNQYVSIFSKLSKGLSKTRSGLVDGISQLVGGGQLDQDVLDEIEELLLLSDMGVDTAERIIDDLRDRMNKVSKESVFDELKAQLAAELEQAPADSMTEKPCVISIVGVNGVGKTTTIGKLSALFQTQGKTVLMAAADTFRAAAIDQLKIWAERTHSDFIHNQPGGDPGSVVYDALQAAKARGSDIVLVDTAGRLHTKRNLMQELEKIHRVMKKVIPEAPHKVYLILDATTGQNGLSQAKQFTQIVDVDGVILAKLDGTAKGGIVFSIQRELGLPVRYVGVGEQVDDLTEFDPETFVEALLQ
ncbi:MAG: signal recognition particle-docking protein FtsY [candidate division KSB1 bacterium]|nr:signal recognition particle-docking protein FtsY [candidate division KSB1 bacterium]